MVLLIVRGLLRRPSLAGTPTVTFCSLHIHNVIFYGGYTGTWSSTTLTSLGVT